MIFQIYFQKMLETKAEQPDITLFWSSGSPPCWRIRLYLEEKNINYNSRMISLDKNEQKGSTLLQINPRGMVPTMVYNGIPLHESMAILYFLEDQTNRTLLFPKDKDKLARIYVRMSEFNYYFPFDIFKFTKKKSEWNENHVKKKVKNLHFELQLLNDYLTECSWEYLGGTDFSLIDIVIFPYIALLDRLGYEFLEYPSLRKYFEKVYQRESVQKTIPPHWKETDRKTSLKELIEFVKSEIQE